MSPITACALSMLIALLWTAPAWGQAGSDEPATPDATPTESAPDTAQDVAPDPAATVPPAAGDSLVEIAQPTALPDLAEVKARRAALEKLETKSDTDKAESEMLAAAEQFLTERDRYRRETEEFTRLEQAAPAEMLAVQAELDQPPITLPAAAELDGLDTAELGSRLSTARARLDQQRAERDQIEALPATRTARREAIPADRAAAQARILELQVASTTEAAAEEPIPVATARRWRRQAEMASYEARLERLNRELSNYDARKEVLRAKRQLYERRVLDAQALVTRYENSLAAAQAREAKNIVLRAEREVDRATALGDPIVIEIARENLRLADRIESTVAEIDSKNFEKQIISAARDRWKTAFQSMNEKILSDDFTDAIGIGLRRLRSELPLANAHQRHLEELRRTMNDVVFQIDEYEARQITLVQLDHEIDQRLSAEDSRSSEPVTAQRRERIAEALRRQRDFYLSEAARVYDRYLDDVLTPLHEAEQELIDVLRKFRRLIDERVLWIQSTEPLRIESIAETIAATGWILTPSNWTSAGEVLVSDARSRPIRYGLLAIASLVLLGIRRMIRRRLRRLGELARHKIRGRFSHTFGGLGLTALLALGIALPVWGLGALPATAHGPTELSAALALALERAGYLVFAFAFSWEMCRIDGLGDAHFRWRPPSLKLIRRHLRWFAPFAVAAMILVLVFDAQSTPSFRDSLGRLIFITGMIATATFLFRVVQPDRGLPREYLAKHRNGWLDRLRYVWFGMIVAVPLVMAGMAAAGWYYTAMQVQEQIVWTVVWWLGLVLLHALSLRWLFLTQRNLALEQARRKREELKKNRASADLDPAEIASASAAIDEKEINVAAISAQAKSLLNSLLLFITVIGVIVIWGNVLPAFNVLNDVKLWDQTVTVSEPVTAADNTETAKPITSADGSETAKPGKAADGTTTAKPGKGADGTTTVETITRVIPITLANVGLSLLVVIITIVVSRNIGGLLNITILQRLPITPSGRYALTSVVQYAVVIIGFVVAFNKIGIGWSTVQWLAAAITVGLGFGLQEIFANFVSGLIILFERPIRIGDTVSVGEVSGTVTRIRMRATTVMDWDHKELIVPNKEFVTGRIVNWSLTDSTVRLTITVGIAYGSDTQLAEKILFKVARECPLVLADPPPAVIFNAFGDSSLEFKLRAFLPNIDVMFPAKHELHSRIDAAFRESGIEIAFPQRDLHLRTIDGRVLDALPIRQGETPAFPAAD
jgi:potassium efflux system protein